MYLISVVDEKSLLTVAQVFDEYEGAVVKETTYADRYLVDRGDCLPRTMPSL
jgi:hypothetical protein